MGSRTVNFISRLCQVGRVGGVLAAGAAVGMLSLDAVAQAGPGPGSTYLCQPAIDPKCSPNVVSGTSVVRAGKAGVALKSPNYTAVAATVLAINSAIPAGGYCGRTGQPACPEKKYEVGVKFKADAVSAVINVQGRSLGLSSDPGQACGQLYMDLLKIDGSNETLVSSQLVGEACDTLPQSHSYSYTAKGLEVNKEYMVRGRLVCVFGAIPATGYFVCTSNAVNLQVVSPFGTYSVN